MGILDLSYFCRYVPGSYPALSRSYFAKIIPPKKSGEYFGLFDICGKGASFMGTTLVGLISQLTGHMNYGVAVISVMFVIGFYFFQKAQNYKRHPPLLFCLELFSIVCRKTTKISIKLLIEVV